MTARRERTGSEDGVTPRGGGARGSVSDLIWQKLGAPVARLQPAPLREVVRRTLLGIFQILDRLNLLEGQIEGRAPVNASLAVVSSVRRDAYVLLDFLEAALQAQRGAQGGEVFEALDGTAYALGHELRRAFGPDGLGGENLHLDPAYPVKLAHAHGLLSNCFRQSVVTLARALDPALDALSLFGDFGARREQSFALLGELQSLIKYCRQAASRRDRATGAALLHELKRFRAGAMRYLMYKDWATFEGFIDRLAAGGVGGTWSAELHSLDCYLETLLGQVRMRGVFSEKSVARGATTTTSSAQPPPPSARSAGSSGVRNGWIYRLPDGGEYIALRGGGGGYLLYPRRYGLSSAPYYRIDLEGRVIPMREGQQEGWRVQDLIELQEAK